MTDQDLRDHLAAASHTEQTIVALLALAGEPVGKTRIQQQLASVGIKASVQSVDALSSMRLRGLVGEVAQRGWTCAPEVAWPALSAALDAKTFNPLCEAYAEATPLRKDWQGYVVLRSYRQGIALLRMALVRGEAPERVLPLLDACLQCHEAVYLHPLIDICGRPFEPELMRRIHPRLQDIVLATVLENAQREPEHAPVLRAYAEQYLAESPDASNSAVQVVLAEHLILCGRLNQAGKLIDQLSIAPALWLRAAIDVLRDEIPAALAGFEQGLKAIRRETGKRKMVLQGISGYLYVLALLRSAEPKHLKLVDTYLDNALRGVPNHDTAIYQQLSMLRQIRAGTADAQVLASRQWESALQPFVFRALLHFWLALPQLEERRPQLAIMLELAERAGFDLLSAQLASVLGHLGAVGHERRAIALRQQHRMGDLAEWFEREQPWQRQLNALINLQPAVNVEVVKEARLVWGLSYDPRYGVNAIEPREQKRDAQGGWSKGRAVALKRLSEDATQLDFLTAQDLNVIATVKAFKYYSQSGSRYELDTDKAVAALIGHPLLFWLDAPGTRVELLPGEPELLVKARLGQVTITMQPPVADISDDLCVTRETPTRLRVVRISEAHRRIGAIVGSGLCVPLQAEKQVLKAISAISSIVTVQSDIGGNAADIDQVEADGRLHVHLLPYQQGLKMQILVRPLPNAGAYYPPGSGADSVIADVNGARVEARRNLNVEREAERQLIAACHALDEAESEHGEWLLGQPATCLELLSELQELDPKDVLLAWPDGETFKVSKRIESKQLRLAIKSEKDWFAVSGEVQIDEATVLDLRNLLDLAGASQSRFIALGDNQFLALTNELHRRLQDLSAYSQPTDKGARIHPLASFALEELSIDVGGVKTDKLWKQHLARMRDNAGFTAQLPSTLQAELRDYQLAGFEWLARLAHWGVGACLADDMGLGKTVQALALMLARAPQGPTLVIAPTSVCMNWMSEAARFAPTLNLKLFGDGDRGDLLANVQPFDLVVASYGLLQQEAPRFAAVRWNTIVLDEAQAIKNGATKRSQAVMALQGEFRMVATGTPLENHLGELWNLFRFINPGLLGTLEDFNVRYAGPIERAPDKRAEAGARTRLRRLIQPFILRRTKAQVLAELPSRTEITLPVELSAQELALYESLRRAALDKLAASDAPAAQKSIQILAEIMKLRRACCNPALVAPELGLASSKLTVFARLIDELLENRHKVLVFSQFVDHLSLIRVHLDARGIRYQYLDGSTSMQQRKARVDAFQGGDGDLFLISLRAGGMGINLTAADYVIHMDPWWNPAVEDQASDRAHRMGQVRPVTIYRLVAQHTIEEGIVELHKHKRDLADSLLEGADMAARMSATDMLNMLQEGLKSGSHG